MVEFEKWEVLLKDRLPAYISWEQYEQNLRQMRLNTIQGTGAPRNGPSLLSGILVCGRCGMRMVTQYSNNGEGLRYSCMRRMVDYGEEFCQSLAGKPLDELITRLVFEVLEPASLEISLRVAEDLEAQRARVLRHWGQKLERTRYAVERAFRQYNAAEPENRLVVRTLERQWEEALAVEQELTREYERFLSEQPARLTAEQRDAIRQLAQDIPGIWHAPTTTPSDRQAIVRQLIERVVVAVRGESEEVDVELHWAGGHTSKTMLIRPVARLEQLSYYRELQNHVAELHAQRISPQGIARTLNEEGWRPAKRRETFNRDMVLHLLYRQGLRATEKRKPSQGIGKGSDEWTISELAQILEMPEVTLHSWILKGKVKARQEDHNKRRFWLIRADKAEIDRLRSLRNHPLRWSKHIRICNEEEKR